MTDNQKNDSLAQQIDSQFRRTYSPTYSWADCVAAYSMIPGLRGLWPMSTINATGDVYDHSKLYKTMFYNGNPTFNHTGLVPYIDLDGTGDFLYRADEADLDILGNETYIAASLRGMTIGGWFWFDALGGVDIVLAKDDLALQRSFSMAKSGLDVLTFTVNGVVNVGANTVSATNWYFCVGRFIPSTEINLFTDDNKETTVAAVPATINNSTIGMGIGAAGAAGSFPLDGRATLCFYSAAALPDSYIYSLYHISRPLFGK